jgi:hypothetical protein
MLPASGCNDDGAGMATLSRGKRLNIVCFDIETVPDVSGARRLFGLEDLDDEAVAQVMFHKQRQRTGHEFLRHHLQRVVAISVAMRLPDGRFAVRSVGTLHSSEAELIQRFFHGIDKYTPTLVSWNGGGFDLPVLHYRSLIHGVVAPRYWETGDQDAGFRWNNYLARFHWRHTDLMDVLSGYQPRATAPLDEIAVLLGLPGKLGMAGNKVWGCYQAGELQRIRDYCDSDVLNTYLIYLRLAQIRGQLVETQYLEELARVRAYLAASEAAHLSAFLASWEAAGTVVPTDPRVR